MLAVYLVCLAVGGVFVGLSTLSGVDKGIEASGDHDVDIDLDLDGDLDADGDAGLHDHDHGDVGHEASISDASHGGESTRRKRRWIPFLSFRFWTFTSAFFGLTGALLSWTELTGEPTRALLAGGIGLTTGLTLSYLVNRLKTSVSSGIDHERALVGHVGELVVALRPGEISTVRLNLAHREYEVLATADLKKDLPKGTRVVVLGFNEDGQARVAPEQTLYHLEDT